MSISRAQYDMLLAPLARQRVEKRDGFDYLNISDVRRYLIRLFGFGGFSYSVSEAECISHTEAPNSKGNINQVVSWKVKVTLDVPALGCSYASYAIGTSQQPSLGDAHDMAIKTAESDALKRCAVNLGDQFGLSLYFSDKRNTVFQSVQRTYDERIVSDNPILGAGTPEPVAPEEDVQAIPEERLAARQEPLSENDEEPPRIPDDPAQQDEASDPVDLPPDFWQQMDAIRTATSKAKRLKLASDYRQVITGLGLTKDHPVLTPSGHAITLGMAFDTAIGGA